MIIESGLNPGPTVQLPPVKKIALLPLSGLKESLSYLRQIYSPPVRGSRLISRQKLFPPSQSRSPIAVPLTEESPWDHIRHDKFERSHAIRWLTSLISQLQLDDNEPFLEEQGSIREALVEDAASLLALCAGTASAGTLTRTFTFGHGSLNVQITDIPLQNCDFSTIGAQTWGGACVLTETIVSNPHDFGLDRDPSDPLRVLELGAGTGLVSIVLAQYLSRRPHTSASIYSTDFNATVLANLANNITANSRTLSTTVSLTSAFLDWSQPDNRDPCLPDVFDLIIGADIVYEMDHIVWIKSCLTMLLRPPCKLENRTSRFHLIIPLRPTHALESDVIEQIFPFAQTPPSPDSIIELAIMSKDVIACDANDDEKIEEVTYAYYVIGW
jgi:predicted nicotinamide N-methyase